MNKYFDKNDIYNSNSRIYEGNFTDTTKEKKSEKGLIELLVFMLQMLFGQTFLYKAKLVLVAFSLIGFIGVVGAMEAGSLGMGSGLLIGAVLIAIEYLCLKGRHRA